LVALGDIRHPVYPRSAIKVLQALPLVESGAADAAGFTDKELALACASHSGEPVHVDTAREMLEKLDLTGEALACGKQWPLDEAVARALAASGSTPTRLHNNCSGKHAGMLALAKQLGAPMNGYENLDHPVQQRIRQTMEELTGEEASAERCGIDGCSVPTWAVALEAYARALARMASCSGLPPERATAAKRLMHACTHAPQMVEGTGRFGTDLMRRLGPLAFVKGGAEGVYCAAFPDRGLGLALKIDDGARRGAEAAAAFLISALFADRIKHAEDLYEMQITNWRGTPVGQILPSAELADAMDRLSGRAGARRSQ
jgi:L-asparaginase II